MPVSKKYLNIKVGVSVPGLQGPQNFPAATTWVSAGIPCRGARMVVMKISGTDVNNAIQPPAINVGNTADGSFMLSFTGQGFGIRPSAAGFRIDKGGASFSLSPLDPNGSFYHDFFQCSILSNATTPHTGVVVDVEVFYPTDAADVMQSVGQGAYIPLATI
jgi:hypothetical protein